MEKRKDNNKDEHVTQVVVVSIGHEKPIMITIIIIIIIIIIQQQQISIKMNEQNVIVLLPVVTSVSL